MKGNVTLNNHNYIPDLPKVEFVSKFLQIMSNSCLRSHFYQVCICIKPTLRYVYICTYTCTSTSPHPPLHMGSDAGICSYFQSITSFCLSWVEFLHEGTWTHFSKCRSPCLTSGMSGMKGWGHSALTAVF